MMSGQDGERQWLDLTLRDLFQPSFFVCGHGGDRFTVAPDLFSNLSHSMIQIPQDIALSSSHVPMPPTHKKTNAMAGTRPFLSSEPYCKLT